MSVSGIEEKIRHYQRSIDRSLSNYERLLYCIGQLASLPVTVLHLEVTGVGRTVNSLRKLEYGVGDAARVLVSKWKDMVTQAGNEEDDEACVPDVPESYESPDCDSELESTVTHDTGIYSHNEPEALGRASSPLGELEINDDIGSFDYLKHDSMPTTSDQKDLVDNIKNKSLSHSSKNLSNKEKKHSDKKSQQKDKNISNSQIKVKQKSLKMSNESDLSEHRRKDKNKNKHESFSSASSTSPTKDKKQSRDKKRKHDLNSEDGLSDRKKPKEELSSMDEEEEADKNNLVIYQEWGEKNEEKETNEESEEEFEKDEKLLIKKESQKESSRKSDDSHGDKTKSKDKHHSSSSHRSKSKESSDKSKKDDKHSSSKSHEKSNKESSKSSSYSSSSSKDHSKHKDKDKSKSKHSKDKKSEKEKNSDKASKDEKSKSEDNKNRKQSKESSESKKRKDSHKDGIDHKKQKDSKDKKEQKKKEKRPSEEDEGGIDCNSGTSFADALGMCLMPPKTKKKKENPSPSSSSKSSLHESSASSSKKSKSSSSKIKMESPDSPESPSLLSSNFKLEPLQEMKEEIDLASTLPEPSPHYRPLPQVNHIQRKLEEDQMLAQVIYAKNQRTKVFSGNKTTGYTHVQTLSDMCIRILIDNIDALEFTGGVPYYIIKPILERATPDQLYMLEHHNPYLMEETDSLWQFHCSKDFRTKKREEMESWREMYMRCLDEREAKLKALTANIKQSLVKSTPVRSTKLAYVDHIVKPPRNVLRQQAKYGTANATSKSSDLKKKLIEAASGSSSSNSCSVAPAEKIIVPPPPLARSRHVAPQIKKAKAPLMAKALQAIKGRYKR